MFIGIDLGGTSIKAAVTDDSGVVQAEDSIPTDSHDGPERVVQRIADFSQQLLSHVDATAANISGLGMGVPGLVDIVSGTTKFLPNFPTQWRDVPVAATLTQQLGCPVKLLNDVRTATLGELRFGHGRDEPNVTMAFFSIGTGVGGGVAVDGKLRLGSLGAAGELGHQTIIPNGPRCGCGNRGCLETLASGPAIIAAGIRLMQSGLAPTLHQLVGGSADRVTPSEMARVASVEPTVHEAITNAATWIGIAAANVVTILHPDLIVLGGGVAELGDLLVGTVRCVVEERVGMFPTTDLHIEQSKLGSRAGVLGAVALAQMAGDSLD